MASGKFGMGRHGVQSALCAEPGVPAVANRDMTDFVAQDDLEQGRARQVADAPQLVANQWCRVKTACFECPWHERKACQEVLTRFLGHFPQAVVGRKVAIGEAQGLQVSAQQTEMVGLFPGDTQPVTVEVAGQVVETPDDIECQIDSL